MRRSLPLALLAAVGLATTSSAQRLEDYSAPTLVAHQVKDHALRFNGRNDFVAMPPTVTASVTNTFTMELWANPAAEHQIDAESLAGFAGIEGQRYAVFPSHGTHMWGWGHAGAGISVGTNGVSVYEHAGDYIPAVLVHKQELKGWTHIAVVYRERRPYLYINGELVRVGSVSPQKFVHPSVGDYHNAARGLASGIGGGVYGWYEGDLDNVRIWSRGIATDDIPSLSRTNPSGDGLLVAMDMNRTGAGRGLVVDVRGSMTGENTLVSKSCLALAKASKSMIPTTYGTEKTPVFVPRAVETATRLENVIVDRSELSTPLDPNLSPAQTGATRVIDPSIK